LGIRPILALVKYDSEENPMLFLPDGSWSNNAPHHDLINIAPAIKRKVWVNVYPEEGCIHIHKTRELADRYEGIGRLACVEIEINCKEGDGL
jgi:hypothetical protein